MGCGRIIHADLETYGFRSWALSDSTPVARAGQSLLEELIMSHTRLLPLTFALALVLAATAAAQDSPPGVTSSQSETATVTTVATAERVRFAAPNTVVQLRLEI